MIKARHVRGGRSPVKTSIQGEKGNRLPFESRDCTPDKELLLSWSVKEQRYLHNKDVKVDKPLGLDEKDKARINSGMLKKIGVPARLPFAGTSQDGGHFGEWVHMRGKLPKTMATYFCMLFLWTK